MVNMIFLFFHFAFAVVASALLSLILVDDILLGMCPLRKSLACVSITIYCSNLFRMGVTPSNVYLFDLQGIALPVITHILVCLFFVLRSVPLALFWMLFAVLLSMLFAALFTAMTKTISPAFVKGEILSSGRMPLMSFGASIAAFKWYDVVHGTAPFSYVSSRPWLLCAVQGDSFSYPSIISHLFAFVSFVVWLHAL